MTLIIGRRPPGNPEIRVTEGWAGRLRFTARNEEEGRVFHVRDGAGLYLATLERTSVTNQRVVGFTVYKDTLFCGEMLAFPDKTWSKEWLDPTLYVLYRQKARRPRSCRRAGRNPRRPRPLPLPRLLRERPLRTVRRKK